LLNFAKLPCVDFGNVLIVNHNNMIEIVLRTRGCEVG